MPLCLELPPHNHKSTRTSRVYQTSPLGSSSLPQGLSFLLALAPPPLGLAGYAPSSTSVVQWKAKYWFVGQVSNRGTSTCALMYKYYTFAVVGTLSWQKHRVVFTMFCAECIILISVCPSHSHQLIIVTLSCAKLVQTVGANRKRADKEKQDYCVSVGIFATPG